jgi:hypothetical protein
MRCANCLSSLTMSCAISVSAAATSKTLCVARVRARRTGRSNGCLSGGGSRRRHARRLYQIGEAAAGSAIRSRIGRDGLAIIALRLSQRVCFQRRANAVFRACASILTHVYLRIAATGMKEVAACLGARDEPPPRRGLNDISFLPKRSARHCHVRAFYLSNASGVRRLR